MGKEFLCTNKNTIVSIATILYLLHLGFVCEFFLYVPDRYIVEFSVLLFSFIVSSIVLLKHISGNGFFVFDSFFFVSSIFFCVFLIQPMVDIGTDNFLTYGLDPFVGCVKGTTIYLLSYLALYFGYETYLKNCSITKISKVLTLKERIYISRLSLSLWCAFFGLCVIFLVSNGYSISYIFTLGQYDSLFIDEIYVKFGFMSKFILSLLVCMMYYLAFGEGKITKIAIFLLTGIVFVFFGSRAMILTYMAAPIAYYYTLKKTNPSVLNVFGFIAIIIFMCAVVEAARWGIRSGGSVNVDVVLNFGKLLRPITSNFQVYKEYFLFVDTVPEKTGFLLGKETLLYTVVMAIPRYFWPTKPDAPFRDILSLSVGEQAVINGEAFPILAEFYIDFGVLGCAVYTFLFGKFVGYISNLGRNSDPFSHGIILFSILFPLLFQFVIRGYIPSNIYSLMFVFLPYVLMNLVLRVLKK